MLRLPWLLSGFGSRAAEVTLPSAEKQLIEVVNVAVRFVTAPAGSSGTSRKYPAGRAKAVGGVRAVSWLQGACNWSRTRVAVSVPRLVTERVTMTGSNGTKRSGSNPTARSARPSGIELDCHRTSSWSERAASPDGPQRTRSLNGE